jgi:hypothetical protein
MAMSPFDVHVEHLVSSVARIQELAHMQISPLTKLHCLSYTILILICMQVPWDIYCYYQV